MKTKALHGIFLFLLAIIFTVGLSFVSLELPLLADHFLGENIEVINVATGSGDLSALKTEMFISHFYLREIGYFCLLVIIALIIVGYVTERAGLTSLGAVALFLPVFGGFAFTMFFLGGLGFLRVLWLPVLDISDYIFSLGDAALIPYGIIFSLCQILEMECGVILPLLLIGGGILFFLLGTIGWFHTYFREKGVADFWIYKYSRHPQYLGWILWTYGILFLPGPDIKKMFHISSSLPWVLSTLIIIGVAMMEEVKMVAKEGARYREYMSKSHFMFPLPEFIVKIIYSPCRILFAKRKPESKKEISLFLLFYLIVILFASFLLNNYGNMTKPGVWTFKEKTQRSIPELTRILESDSGRREKASAFEELMNKGENGYELIVLSLNNSDPAVREFAAEGVAKLKLTQAEDILAELTSDKDFRVVASAIAALGELKSEKYFKLITDKLNSNSLRIRFTAAGAIGNIGSKPAYDSLFIAIKDNRIKVTPAILGALERYDSPQTRRIIMENLTKGERDLKIRAIFSVLALNMSESVEMLKKMDSDKDWEIRIYSSEVIKMLENRGL